MIFFINHFIYDILQSADTYIMYSMKKRIIIGLKVVLHNTYILVQSSRCKHSNTSFIEAMRILARSYRQVYSEE